MAGRPLPEHLMQRKSNTLIQIRKVIYEHFHFSGFAYHCCQAIS